MKKSYLVVGLMAAAVCISLVGFSAGFILGTTRGERRAFNRAYLRNYSQLAQAKVILLGRLRLSQNAQQTLKELIEENEMGLQMNLIEVSSVSSFEELRQCIALETIDFARQYREIFPWRHDLIQSRPDVMWRYSIAEEQRSLEMLRWLPGRGLDSSFKGFAERVTNRHPDNICLPAPASGG